MARVESRSNSTTKTSAAASTAPDRTGKRVGSMTRMPLEQFFQLQQTDGALIYDVRPGFVYAFGHVPGAVSWPKRAFASKLSQFEPAILAANRSGKPVVLYCTDAECPDSRTVAGWLTDRGLDVYVLEGGWAAWKEGDLPTE
ncbi:rhodanese-like domain-containing protein [Luteolibacter pohnpeiensis]|uniref:Rhodanese-like domain-containing protein n=1 Tax=Luteolibacter pohnpeiensis TaxID=454153 RepID=A0A934S4J7_9BACT|nr:rhodanese-like domain-containing protein [Luteolibacter pohnpeiensis]MBK1882152.1 rhodanese-like domain-containing protein [Luteolibacter pohnpeiensis]